MANQHIQFGKYIFDTFKEILEKDPSYAKWLTNQHKLDADIKDYLLDNLPNEGYIMTFGKYKNKPLDYIKRVDHKYIQYLNNNSYVQEKMPDLVAALKLPIT